MADMESTMRAVICDLRDHLAVIIVSVTVAVAMRWAVWIAIPPLLLAGAYACWRRGWRIVIDRTEQGRETREC